ncbi:uncharacterized protein LOC130052997 [Ostrea edulis]|uniref:uncharacterized protein LOC130052997 n=1 Tax=Ostrea edulis TaxID=37623 RepID=UPI0024AF9A8A|nr:uncharacterized protein LOC130052997 [Ostrea edulis]
MESTEISTTTSEQTTVSINGPMLTTDDQVSTLQTKKLSPKKSNLSTTAIGLLATISVLTVGIVVTSGLCIRKKCSNERPKSNDEWERPLAKKGELTGRAPVAWEFDPPDLFSRGSQAEFFSRPPSRTSLQQIPPTNDFTHIFDKDGQHLDKLFSVKK